MFPHIRWRLLSALPRLYLLQHSRSRSTPRPVLQFFTSFLPYYCYNRRGYAEVTNSAFYRHLSVAASANSDGQQPGTISSLRVDIEDVSGAIADSFCDCVLEIGATSAMTEEFRPHGAQEEAIFAHDAREDIGSTTSQEGPRLWKRCTVVVHFPPDLTTTEAKKHIKRVCNSLGLDFNEDSLKLSYVRAQDWEQVIRNGYQPMKVTDTLYILPSWSKPVEKNATNVILGKPCTDSKKVSMSSLAFYIGIIISYASFLGDFCFFSLDCCSLHSSKTIIIISFGNNCC